MNVIEEQVAPTPNERPGVWGLVLEDMAARDAVGRERYGTPLQPHNGRDPLVDAYQEALDLVVYLRQAIAERDGLARVPALPHREVLQAEIDRLAWKEAPDLAPTFEIDHAVRVNGFDLAGLIKDLEHKTKQVNELQASMTGMVQAGLHRRVVDFFGIAGQTVRSTPTIPEETEIRFRWRLIAEEVLEGLDATFKASLLLADVRQILKEVIGLPGDQIGCPISVDLPKLVDAWGDIDYVVEGARVSFGVDGTSVMTLIHNANMAKGEGPVVNGKKLKPVGWVAPDITGELLRQGWVPE